MTSAGQVIGNQHWVEVGSRRIVEGGIDDPKRVLLVQECLLVNQPRLHIVNSLYIRDIGPQASVREQPILAHSFRLKVGQQVGERISAGVVVIVIAAYKSPECEH